MSKSLKKLIDINRLREFKNKLVGTGSAYVQTGAVDQTVAGTKDFLKPIVGSVTGSSGSCTGNAASANIATKATQDSDGNKITTTYSKNGHTHDDRYYTENEVNNLLNGKANTSGTYSNLTVGNAGSATNATYTNWLRTSSHSDHLFHTEWDGAGYFWTYVTAGNGDYRAVRVARSDSAATAQACTGNAASATKLQTARTINGIKFDGTANITIPGTVPAGVIIPFAGTSVPTGYLLCNGAAVSRTNYANLFAAIGTLYGAGDGSTTFNLPDARDRVLQGASGGHSAGSYIGAGLPNITGGVGNGGGFYCYSGGSRAFFVPPSFIGSAHNTGSGENLYGGFEFNAQRFNALYGASNTVQSPAIATNFIIKY